MKHILVPLDGSLLAEQALPTAISLARRHDCALELILVNGSRPGGGLEGWPWAISSAASHGDYIADRADAARKATGRAAEFRTAEGLASVEICRRAAESHADLIVMAGHGRTGLARVLGGSTADAVIRHAHIPVLVLRSAESTRRVHATALRVERIVIAVDGSRESLAALDAATTLAEPGITELHLVEVVSFAQLSTVHAIRRRTTVDRAATAEAIELAEFRLNKLTERIAAHTGCDTYSHVVASDDPARAIVRTAYGFNASFIVMGSRGRGASRALLGSVVEHVLVDGRCPMLVFHPSTASKWRDQSPAENLCAQPSR